jgi:hypothetical protein
VLPSVFLYVSLITKNRLKVAQMKSLGELFEAEEQRELEVVLLGDEAGLPLI